jgi:hypothetical protein
LKLFFFSSFLSSFLSSFSSSLSFLSIAYFFVHSDANFIAFVSSFFQISAASLFKGSSGFGALNNA